RRASERGRMSETGGDPPHVEQLRRRLKRERAARLEAEAIAERVTGELYTSIGELRTLNERVERTNRDLEAANQTLRDFVAIASHDLRGPVSAVLGFASTLLGKWGALSESDKLEFLSIIERRGRFLSRMLDSLLTVSKIEAGALDVNREVLRAEDVVSRALEDIEHDRREQVEVHCPTGLLLAADPDHVQRILVNYITNAFKYGRPPVSLEASSTGQFVEFVVRDHGDGIPEGFRERLFHKFARAEVEATRKEKGAGLGLSIVQGLARANDGEAWYEANKPNGSCFGVRLPGTEAA
ncbi:MAG: sensor histidine kinase, partial [Actinomycetota bacterium]